MNYAVLVLLLLLTITFGFSAKEKIFEWKATKEWMEAYFKTNWVPRYIPILLGILLVVEVIASLVGIAAILALIQAKDYKSLAVYAALLYSFSLLFMLVGQRINKDYDGARNIVIYLIPVVILLYLIQ